MGKLSSEVLLKRAARGFTEQESNRDLWSDIKDFTIPQSNTFYEANGAGDTRIEENVTQYDSAGLHCMQDFVSAMAANITPKDYPFAKLVVGELVVNESIKSKLDKALEYINNVIYGYLDASNFYIAISHMYAELGTGTGALWCLEGTQKQPLNFISTDISQLGLTTGNNNEIDTIIRKQTFQISKLESLYPGKEIKLSASMKADAEKDPDFSKELYEIHYYDYEDLIWRFALIEQNTKQMIVEEEYKERIVFTPRWLSVNNKAFGIGPFALALPDIKTLNKAKELTFRNAELSIYGVFTAVSDNQFNPNNVVLEPGAIIPVSSNGGARGRSIDLLPQGGNFQIQQFLLDGLREDIKKTTYNDKLPEPQATPSTAFEISQRIREFSQNFSSVYPIMQYELVAPLLKRIISILTKKGIIDLKAQNLELPKGVELEDLIDGVYIKVAIQSPVAQLQQKSEVEKLAQAIEIINALTAQPSKITELGVNLENIPNFVLTKYNVSTDLMGMNPEELKDELVKLQKQQQQAIAQEQAAIQEQAKQQELKKQQGNQ